MPFLPVPDGRHIISQFWKIHGPYLGFFDAFFREHTLMQHFEFSAPILARILRDSRGNYLIFPDKCDERCLEFIGGRKNGHKQH